MIIRAIRRLLTPPMVVLAALFLFTEEWIWKRMTALMAWVARAPVFRALERWLSRLPPWGALIVFLLPGLSLLPVKIAAVFLMGRGHVTAGIGVLVGAKVLGTAIVARLFAVCRPALLTVSWFRRLHDWLLATKESLYARIRAMRSWQSVLAWKTQFSAKWKHATRHWRGGSFRRRWRAIGSLMRHRIFPRRRRQAQEAADHPE